MKKQRYSVLDRVCNDSFEQMLVNAVRRNHPLLSQIGESVMYEGNFGEITDESGIATSDFSSVHFGFSIPHETISKVDIEAFRLALIMGIAEMQQNSERIFSNK